MNTVIKRCSALNFGSVSPITLPPANDHLYLNARAHIVGAYAFNTIGSQPCPMAPHGLGVGVSVGV